MHGDVGCRVCRLAFAKQPLASEGYLETVGYHLVGLPDVYVTKTYGGEREVVAVMDEVGDGLAERGLQVVVSDRKVLLSDDTSHQPDDFKFNPHGIVTINRH